MGEDARLSEARQTAMELRKGGMSYRAIAQTMGVNVHTAYDYVQAELLELRKETTEDTQTVRDMELARCDEMMAGLEEGIKAGDPMSVNAAIRVMERRARLMGLDAPEKKSVTGVIVSAEMVASLSDEQIRLQILELMDRVSVAALPALPALALTEGEGA